MPSANTMIARTPPTETECAAICRDFQADKPLAEIAWKYHRSQQTVRAVIKAAGLRRARLRSWKDFWVGVGKGKTLHKGRTLQDSHVQKNL